MKFGGRAMGPGLGVSPQGLDSPEQRYGMPFVDAGMPSQAMGWNPGPGIPQGFPPPGLPPTPLDLGYSPGSLRNTLGSGLKSMGIFRKDGQIQNLRGGFIGPKHAGAAPPWGAPSRMPLSAYGNDATTGGAQSANSGQGGTTMGTLLGGHSEFGQPRQMILQAAQQGIYGNGIATISPDNSFMLIANLPPPHTFAQSIGLRGPVVYASYLVEKSGKTGFLAGVLTPVGNGVYRAQFRSPVPLHSYDKVVISIENPQQLGQAPFGPIILKVKEPLGLASFLNPVKSLAGSVRSKVAGLFSRGGKAPAVPPGAGSSVPEAAGLAGVAAGAAGVAAGTAAIPAAGTGGGIAGAAGAPGATPGSAGLGAAPGNAGLGAAAGSDVGGGPAGADAGRVMAVPSAYAPMPPRAGGGLTN